MKLDQILSSRALISFISSMIKFFADEPKKSVWFSKQSWTKFSYPTEMKSTVGEPGNCWTILLEILVLFSYPDLKDLTVTSYVWKVPIFIVLRVIFQYGIFGILL